MHPSMPLERREEFESFLESIMELHLGTNAVDGSSRTARTMIQDMYSEHRETVTCKYITCTC